jgi:hypothetical protein
MTMLIPVAVAPSIAMPRPMMPTAADQTRSLQQAARVKMMMGDWTDLLTEDMAQRIDADRLAQWGEADTSCSPLSDMCRQWSTPGLYGSRPEVSHADSAAQEMVGPGGWVDKAGYWTAMQTVQYLTLGVGDWPVRVDAGPDGLTYRLPSPSDVWVWSTQDRPDVPVILWELRLRAVTVGKITRWVYAWDQYDIGETLPDGTVVREPSYRVVEAGGIHDGSDITNLVIPGAPVGGFVGTVGEVGTVYPFRKANGRAFLPWVIYRAVDSKSQWNVWQRRDAMRGTLNAATHWTYAGHCARDASGTCVVIGGLMPIGGNVSGAGQSDKNLSVNIVPGAFLYHATMEGSQPFVQEVGPGGNLEEVTKFAHDYEGRQLVRWGLSSDDVSKSSADPQSGAALYISNQAKRQYANMVKPLFQRGDLEILTISADMLRLAGVGDYPTEGYSIVYAEIPKSAAESQEERAKTDWDLAHGHISEVEAYMRTHPGATEEAAIAALTKAAVNVAKLEKAKADALIAAGLAPSGESAPHKQTAEPPDDATEPDDPADDPEEDASESTS